MRIAKNIKMLFLLVILLLVCTSCTSKQQETTGDNSQFSILNSQFKIIITGDVLLDRGVRPYAEREGIPALFAGVDSVFRQADAVIVNLECPLTDTVSPVNKHFVFGQSPSGQKDCARQVSPMRLWPTTIPTTKDDKVCFLPISTSRMRA